MRRVLFVLLAMFIFPTLTAIAQDDGRVDPRPGDRVITFCQSTKVEVWGATDEGIGVFLTSIPYDSFVANVPLSRFTTAGQVVAVVDRHGNFSVRWLGGPYHATGTGDFKKNFVCPFAVPVNVAPANVPPQEPPTTTVPNNTVSVSQEISLLPTNITVNQSVTVTRNTTVACGSNTYTVRTGDNLFRISLRFGTTVGQLAACNGIADPSRIYVGQVLNVP